MNGVALLLELRRTNPQDVGAIIAQCGGDLQAMEMLAHVSAIQASFNTYPNDAAKGLDMVWKRNLPDIRYLFTDIGGLEGLIKIFPNVINILGTIEKNQPKTGV